MNTPRKRGRPSQGGLKRPHRIVVTLSDAELAQLRQSAGSKTPALLLRALSTMPERSSLTFAAASIRLYNSRHIAPEAYAVADWLDRIAEATR